MWKQYLLVSLTFAIMASPSWGQEGTRVSINAPGNHVRSVRAERLRVAIPLFAHALTADEAIELLRSRKERAKERCQSLQADQESIQFSGLTVESFDLLRGNNFAVVQRMNGNNGLDITDLPQLVTARVDMVVEWQLPSADDESRLALTEQIVSSLREPDLTGKDERPEFAPRVEEALESARTQSMMYSSRSGGVSQDEIRYVFVALITPETIQEGFKAAVEDAKTSVTAMATAAGMQLGQMVSVSSNQSYSSTSRSYSSVNGSRPRRDVLVARQNEVVGDAIDELEYATRVHLQYTVNE